MLGGTAKLSPAEKIAQLEALLDKKEQDISLLKLTCRRLEEELIQLRAAVTDGFEETEKKMEATKLALEERMNVIEGASWSGRLTSKYLTASEKLKTSPDVGILFSLSTGSKTITTESAGELQCVALSEILRTQDCRVEVLELAHSDIGVRGTIMLAQTLAVNAVLRTINLASCNIGAAGAIALWHYVKATRCPLEVVDIRDNNVALGRVVEAMELALAKKPSIRAVGFDFSRDALVESLRIVQEDPERYHLHAPSLLDLSRCSITDQDVPAVVALLLRVSVVCSVNLCDNGIGDEGAELLARVLDANDCVEAIAVAGNACQAAILARADDARLNVWSCLYPSRTVRLDYASDFDENGLMFFLGTNGRTRPYENPAKTGQVLVTSSEGKARQQFASVVGRERAGCAIYYKPQSWFAVDLGAGRSAAPHAYTLRHGREDGTDALRSWEFQGSQDGKVWVTIKAHDGDAGLTGAWSTCTWHLDPDPGRPQGYQMFRIRKTGPNSSNRDHLHLGGIEIYGDFFFK